MRIRKGEAMKEVMKNERKRTFLLITIPILALFICFNTIPLIRAKLVIKTGWRGRPVILKLCFALKVCTP